jgi:hypothetical protein
MEPEVLVEANRLEDVIADIKDEIRTYKLWRNWAIVAASFVILFFIACVATGIVSNMINTVDLGEAVFVGIIIDLFIGFFGSWFFATATEDMDGYPTLKRRLRGAERGYRDYMTMQGLG